MPLDLKNPSSKNVLIKALLAILIGLLGWYIYISVEVYEESSPTGFSQEARSEPYLAAQMLLETYQINAKLYDDFRLLYSSKSDSITPSFDDAIILSDAQIALPKSMAKQLLSWVEGGGHLIVALNSNSVDEDFRANSLISELDVGTYWLEDEIDASEGEIETIITNADDLDMRVNLESSYRLDLSNNESVFYSAGDEVGATFAQMERGDGLISLLTEVNIWNNYQIDDFDNVELLLALTSTSENVLFFSSKELPHWFSILYDFSPYFIWLGIALILLAMWRAAVRFGPVLKEDKQSFSPFSDHINAAGEYYWRNQQSEQLLQGLRDSVLLAFYKKRPQLKGAEQAEVLHALSELSGWQESTLQEILYNNHTLNESQFTRLVEALQSLRNTL